MIRPATYDDLAELVAFVGECHAVMPWAQHGLGPDTDSVIATLLDLLESPAADLSVVELDGLIAGVCAVVLGNAPWSRNMVIASEWIWHMRPSFPDGHTKRRWIVRMLDNMMDWARDHGATVFKVSTIHGDTPLTRLLARRGIVPMETCCAGRL
ncbi:MAG: hypothetical protein AB7D27_14650 [Desulfomicrobium sp.]